jgi:hypothetical protein
MVRWGQLRIADRGLRIADWARPAIRAARREVGKSRREFLRYTPRLAPYFSFIRLRFPHSGLLSLQPLNVSCFLRVPSAAVDELLMKMRIRMKTQSPPFPVFFLPAFLLS